jgi:hypothetical protein
MEQEHSESPMPAAVFLCADDVEKFTSIHIGNSVII